MYVVQMVRVNEPFTRYDLGLQQISAHVYVQGLKKPGVLRSLNLKHYLQAIVENVYNIVNIKKLEEV